MDAKGRPTSADLPYEVLFRAIATAAAAKPGTPERNRERGDLDERFPHKVVTRKVERLEDWGVVQDYGCGVFDPEMWSVPVQHEHLRAKFLAILDEVGPAPTLEEWTAYYNAVTRLRAQERMARVGRRIAGEATTLDLLVDRTETTLTDFQAHVTDFLMNGGKR